VIKLKVIGPAVFLAAAVLAASGVEKTDFSGVWVVNPQKSQLADWAKFDVTTITIEHKDLKFRFQRVSVKAGKTDESGYDFTTDGDTLVFHARMVLPDGREATDIVRYTLRDGGKTFVAEEKFRGPVVKYDNLWVADKRERPE
jgi:hypothetical protein